MATDFMVRRATVADAGVITRHRVEMFKDMGVLPPQLGEVLATETVRYLEEAMPNEEYVGWLAASSGRPEEIVAGAGLQRRRVLPHPQAGPGGIGLADGRQGIVLNVFTERAFRCRGLAELLMRHVIAWAERSGLETLVLHTSDEGRRLYERLGFVPTNEMRYTGSLVRGRVPR